MPSTGTGDGSDRGARHGHPPERATAALGGVCALAGRPAGDDLHRAPAQVTLQGGWVMACLPLPTITVALTAR
jgi:hypothetical protein